MQEVNLEQIKSPQDIKNFSQVQLEQLAEQIRAKLVQVTEQCGGHLASNLGVVELTIALHAVMDTPQDKIIWDVSHQTYVHKMLTGRIKEIMNIRQFGGLSGFTKIMESEYDSFGAGHASTSLSAALGIAHARDLQKENYAVVSVLGDGSLSGGMIYEALNNAEKLNSNFICILNDNNMSISQPIGSMAKYMTQLRTSDVYNLVKQKFEHVFTKIPNIGVPLKRKIEKTVERIRDLVLDFKFGVLFEEFGFRYLGPLDGHNIPLLMAALKYAKSYNGPIIIHILTKKGKGYDLAENDPVNYHGVNPKNKKKATNPTFTQIFGKTITELASHEPNLVVVTPAMTKGSGLDEFASQYPTRFFDVGIAEEHSVTFAAGLARAGIKPVLAIYSTFLQRGYDQVVHDVCLQNLPVIFAIDRAGLVGEDGPTHHGVFDIAFLLHIPNLTILSPINGEELKQMLAFALEQKSPIAIRFPKDAIPDITLPQRLLSKSKLLLDIGSLQKKTKQILLISTGLNSYFAYEAAQKLSTTEGLCIKVLHLPFIKPLDTETLNLHIQTADQVFVIEEGCCIGGLYTYILQNITTNKSLSNFIQIALPDKFIEHGSNEILRDKYHLSIDKLADFILKQL